MEGKFERPTVKAKETNVEITGRLRCLTSQSESIVFRLNTTLPSNTEEQQSKILCQGEVKTDGLNIS